MQFRFKIHRIIYDHVSTDKFRLSLIEAFDLLIVPHILRETLNQTRVGGEGGEVWGQ